MPWLTSLSFLKMPRWVWLGLAAAMLMAGGLFLWTRSENADDQHNQEIGATVEREAAQAAVIERAEEAQDVREEIRQPGPVGDRVRYDQCVRSARTPANCVRFLPSGSAPDD